MRVFSDLGDEFNLLNVPGLGVSGDLHWQTFWENSTPAIIRVEQDDWDNPRRESWVNQLERVVAACDEKPIILIGHSLGCGTIIHAVAEGKLKRVAGALLVALPDIERPDFPKECIGFAPVPRIALPFPTCMVLSENDPYASAAKQTEWAGILRAEPINIGEQGHVGSEAELENWPEGQGILMDFLDRNF